MMEPPAPTETDETRDDRLGGPVQFAAAYTPPQAFPGKPLGPGRWFLLYGRNGEEALGYVWTNDTNGLGFRATTPAGIQRQAEYTQALQAATLSATEVFDWWAGTATAAFAAGPVTRGRLEDAPFA